MSKQPDKEQLQEMLRQALRKWYKESSAGNPLQPLLLFQRMDPGGSTERRRANELLLQALERLEENQAPHAALLRSRYLDGQSVQVVANSMNVSTSTVYMKQREALEHLAEVVQKMEEEAQASKTSHALDRLPLPGYTKLVGSEQRLAELRALLVAEDEPWIISLVGIGGIGKTSLADALLRSTMGGARFANYGWVSAQRSFLNPGGAIEAVKEPALTVDALVDKLGAQLLGEDFSSAQWSDSQKFAQLRSCLKEEAHLVVIDNLETLTDVESLLDTLRLLVGPSKFLLTSREFLFPQAHLLQKEVPPLTEAQALQLVRQVASASGDSALDSATDSDLHPIFDSVGGNPLALRLVVGQSRFHGFRAVLDNLQAARGRRVEEMYTHIYRHAWDNLDEAARRVFLAMPLISNDGGDLDMIEKTTMMERAELLPALEHLVTLSLVEARVGLRQTHYTIHNLTRTFLQQQVAKWV